MLPEKDEVIIAVSLHELDFVALLRAARMLGTTRENVIRQALADCLVQTQRQGLDLGIELPPEPCGETGKNGAEMKEPGKKKAVSGNGKKA